MKKVISLLLLGGSVVGADYHFEGALPDVRGPGLYMLEFDTMGSSYLCFQFDGGVGGWLYYGTWAGGDYGGTYDSGGGLDLDLQPGDTFTSVVSFWDDVRRDASLHIGDIAPGGYRFINLDWSAGFDPGSLVSIPEPPVGGAVVPFLVGWGLVRWVRTRRVR